MFFDMKVLLVVFAFGILLNVAQLKANAVINLDLSLFTENADAVKGSYKPCCHPENLEGSWTDRYSQNAHINFHFDAINRRYAEQVVGLYFEIKIILVSDSQRTCLIYGIEESQKKCSKYKQTNASIDDVWIRCIPNNATSQGTMRIGSDEKQSSLLLQNWMFTHHGTNFQRLVTDVDCIPVADFINPNSSQIQQAYYFDITTRIKDPSVFTPPPYCDEVNDRHEGSEFQQRMFTSLFATLK